MDVKLELKRIYTNRLLQSQREINEFEEALTNLINLRDTSNIYELCMSFDDDTEQYEIMFGLIHGIEYLYKEDIEEGLSLLARAVPNTIDKGLEWMEILHYRILNHEEIRNIYGRVLSGLDIKTQKVVAKLLEDIKSEDPNMFSNSVNEVLRYL